jgi:L-serine/L-threonine ammonia-lyase
MRVPPSLGPLLFFSTRINPISSFVSRLSLKSFALCSIQSSSSLAIMSTSTTPAPTELYQETPLIKSFPLSKLCQRDVYLKLDALQASGSFKDRGMAHLCRTLQQQGVKQLISSSGGNAGLAVATVAQQLNMIVQVIVPKTTKPIVVEKLKHLGADVTVHGENWNQADTLARQRVADSQGAAEYISPYDNPLLWTGHATIVPEIVKQLGDIQVACIVLSVGGGGLLCGVLEGCATTATVCHVVAAETQGASCFGQSLASGKVVTLAGIDSVATSLGATSPTPAALERSQLHVGGVASAICTDKEAVQACLQLAQDHRLLVEPACGAALAIAYSPRLRDLYLKTLPPGDGAIVLQVCGGSGVSIDLLQGWKQEFGIE